MDLSRVGIVVDARGAISELAKFSGSAANAGKATARMEKQTRRLSRSLTTLGGLLGIRQLIEYADTWTLINARVRLVTTSTGQANQVQQALFDVAQRGRNTLAATAVLYQRIALNTDELGVSQNDLIGIVSAVNAGLLTSGSTGVEAAQSMRQLAQAFGKGKLDGDEFRTVMEAMPAVAQALADSLGVPLGGLQALSQQGIITGKVMAEALLGAQKELEDKAANMPLTISQSAILLRNAITRMVGILNTASGASLFLANSLKKAADNMDKMIASVVAMIAMLVAYKIAALAAATAQALIVSGAVVKGFRALAAAIRSAAVSQLLLNAAMKAAKGGFIGIGIALFTAGAGFLAFRETLKQVSKAIKEFEREFDASSLDKLIGEKQLDFVDPKVATEIRQRIREATQTLVLSGLSEKAAARQAIAFDAVNKTLEARGQLTGLTLSAMEQTIAAEARLELQTLQTEEAVEAANAAQEERMQIMQQFAQNFQQAFADVFARIFDDGLNSFKDLFSGIKKLFIRLIADMVAAKMMQRIGVAIAGSLSAILGTSTEAVAAQTAATAARVAATDPKNLLLATAGKTERVNFVLEGVTVPAAKSLASQIALALGPLLGGFAVGQLVGGLTPNRGLGVLGGAAGGAATGALIGSALGPLGAGTGAILGGLAGAIGGLLGSNKKRAEIAERLKRNALLIAANNLALDNLRQSFDGQQNQILLDALQFEPIINRLLFLETGEKRLPSSFEAGIFTLEEQTLLKELAKQLNITLVDPEGKLLPGALDQLVEAIRETVRQLTEFGNNLNDIQSKQAAFNKLFDVAESPQQLLSDTFAVLNQLAPQLTKVFGLDDLDLNTAAGRAALLEGLRNVFTAISEGDLTLELLGAFTDKNQLLDSILRVKDGLDAFGQQLGNVVTDFPRAMDIIFFEQRFGRFGNAPSVGGIPGFNPDDRAQFVITGGITIQNNTGDTGEVVLEKIERAAQVKRSRGGRVAIADPEAL